MKIDQSGAVPWPDGHGRQDGKGSVGCGVIEDVEFVKASSAQKRKVVEGGERPHLIDKKQTQYQEAEKEEQEQAFELEELPAQQGAPGRRFAGLFVGPHFVVKLRGTV